MLVLALRSIRQRPGRFLATLLSAFLGAAIIMTFNSMHDTAAGDGVDAVSSETLGTAAGVVGGYGTLLVFFAVASTLTVNVRQRAAELELLRCSGATPAQIKRMVVGEAVAVALAGAALAVGPAMLGGRALLEMFQDSGQVARSVDYAFGPIALLSGVDITLVAAAGAAFLAVRRVTRGRGERAGAKRFLAYAALVAGAAGAGSTFLSSATDEALMAAPAYGAILLSVGLALLSPGLLRGVLGRLPQAGPSVWLAVRNLRERAAHLAGILVALILFTAVSTATLTMQAVESDAVKASGLVKSVDAKNLETLNLTVVGIIAVFVCVMLVNSLYAATTYRSREFGQQRLAGATPGQVLRVVAAEGVILTLTGVVLGTVAALAGVVPFTVVRTDAVLPDQFAGVWLAMVSVTAAVTLGTSLATARRVLRTPAVGAVALAA
ncbi:FtsX-like permease family protein [Streptomyces parvulus]|uniref:FtsX-like permease family protein n=1 Tax=Streptomyces TaxID=1883 RepID=UPI00136D30C9|nr:MULTISPECIES: FtsX-like permease family protein [Streptomyces]MCC9155522.1 FtsX-like permease family protein [Streptomyces parvulus]MCE7687776.1 FtsX-like permease family protein [Streptomyces parvulus]MCQ4192799.1 FtsX-like permease family protein [Streptomyces parvulus]MZD55720.1 FtsX-like permease family protein [Streptomyces sp. SID5606]WHM29185.1 FtsX-like permease family protein [Streptomyces sp. BPPL-273]